MTTELVVAGPTVNPVTEEQVRRLKDQLSPDANIQELNYEQVEEILRFLTADAVQKIIQTSINDILQEACDTSRDLGLRFPPGVYIRVLRIIDTRGRAYRLR
jgi:hypothetical protein